MERQNRFKKLLIAGGRDFDDRTLFLSARDEWIIANSQIPVEIVSGACPTGADAMGEKWAEDFAINLQMFPANWKLYGRSAGPRRNRQMAQYCDEALIFWDGQSKGTQNMMEELDAAGKPYKTILYPPK